MFFLFFCHYDKKIIIIHLYLVNQSANLLLVNMTLFFAFFLTIYTLPGYYLIYGCKETFFSLLPKRTEFFFKIDLPPVDLPFVYFYFTTFFSYCKPNLSVIYFGKTTFPKILCSPSSLSDSDYWPFSTLIV